MSDFLWYQAITEIQSVAPTHREGSDELEIFEFHRARYLYRCLFSMYRYGSAFHNAASGDDVFVFASYSICKHLDEVRHIASVPDLVARQMVDVVFDRCGDERNNMYLAMRRS